MDEYLCMTLVGHPGESEAAFKARLTAFWTHLLRTRPTVYEQLYAEATAFDRTGASSAKRYMVAADAVAALLAELTAMGMEVLPVEEDEVYSKYEASGSEWFQIEH